MLIGIIDRCILLSFDALHANLPVGIYLWLQAWREGVIFYLGNCQKGIVKKIASDLELSVFRFQLIQYFCADF